MAVTITPAEVAVAIRAAATKDTVPGPVTTVLAFLVPAATAMLLEYAPGAPDAMHNAALVRLAGWLYDADPTDARVSSALYVSGASNLLGQWRVHRAGAVGSAAPSGGGTPGPSPTPGAGLPTPPESGYYILTVRNGVLAWVEFPRP
ncbi:MAG: hypothetical protein OXI22_08030 [Defluviicoccus sp.]|nr:hypothetical protein [Defluviicoccus sp.]